MSPRPAESTQAGGTAVRAGRPADPAAGTVRGKRSAARRRHRADPRGHWFLVVAVMVLTAGALVLDAYVAGAPGKAPEETYAPPHPPGAPSTGLGRVRRGGPVLNLTGPEPASVRLPARTLALTFEDGPDPRWTPRLLDVLAEHGAKATFFAVGARIAENPALTRRIIAEGHEIGNHSYVHPDPAAVPGWRLRLELSLTQKALAGAAGVYTRLARPPYSSAPAALTDAQLRAMRVMAGEGYLLALTDLDAAGREGEGTAGRDAADRDGAETADLGAVDRGGAGTAGRDGRETGRIVRAATPRAGRGAIVTMRGSGDDGGRTAEAVDRLLTRLAARGYRATTLTSALGMPPAHVAAGQTDRFVGTGLILAQRGATGFTAAMSWIMVAAGALTLLRLVLFLGLARTHARRARGGPARGGRTGARRVPQWTAPPGVTVIVPAYNEEAGIAATVRSLVDTGYRGALEVIVVDDGSSDGTAAAVAALGLPRVRVIRQENGGKPAALNTGIAHASHDILIMVDGDTVFEPATIGNLVRPLADPTVGAVSGNTKVGNRSGMLGRWQHIEYVIGFNLDRRAFDLLGCMPTVPGAIGAFRRSALAAVGGLSGDTLAEDTDLTMAMCRDGWRVVYEETAPAWTEAPASLRQMWRQRYRWCYGTLQAMWKHRRAVVEPGPFGRRCLGYLALFQVVLPLLAPVVDVMAVYGAVVGEPLPAVAVWAGFGLLQAVGGWYALRLDREPASVLWALPLQQLVYRQLMYLVVIQSVVTAVLGARLHWQTIRREGTFSGTGPVPVPVPGPAPVPVPTPDARAGSRRRRRRPAPGRAVPASPGSGPDAS
ncbi:bifunctional polysaccharide deacetylase/glycosyltransferase family 2 protein [Planomonospora parontospora]|uniref:bifunctional polysaccharide deacetylase/glycosyltransferase family 2 protein n=1 Tax=Planomonospora parontospora TaxID=58119 RepID=UPI001986461D|nr:bifunctional polysaccharide deacetylase/glycosyltransferase family 2 protein [Planomonospora parontospora]GGL28847.1 bi-functional transferase/deacetylase [Planomonospora parontospora subsp. antibiotica]GII18093.1 bi-functional transferase/deacetylase [Planomonospora parontospora subsp. antibiotica]